MTRRPVLQHVTALPRAVLAKAGVDHHLYLWNLRRQVGPQPLVVYSMPKVGSTTLLQAARAGGRRAIPAHRLSPKGRAAEAAQTAVHAPKRRSTKLWRAGYGGVWRSDYIAQRLARSPKAGTRWEVITGVRDPVARSISGFFHASERTDTVDPNAPADRVDLDELRTRWIDAYWRGHSHDWFAEELEPTTGIDVFSSPFTPADGYADYENAKFRVLLVRNEDIDRVGARALAEFLRSPAVDLPRHNRATDKAYGDVYRRFAAEVTVPDDILDHAYGTRVAQHFYTDAEREACRRRWSTHPSDVSPPS